jgi:hypothetical protein
MEVVDLTGKPAVQAELTARQLAQEFLEQNIDISVDPLFDSKLLKVSDNQHVLVLALDHIVSDGRSYAILNREIWGMYEHITQARPLNLPTQCVQFPDYAVWQQRTYEDWKRKHQAYWKMHMDGAGFASIPPDIEERDSCAEVVAVEHFSLGSSLSMKLRAAARQEGSPLHLLVLAIYVVVMSRWCGRDDLVIWYMSHGRHHRPELECMVGLLISPLHLRIRLTQEDTFLDLLERVRSEVSLGFDHLDFNRVPHILPECRTELEFHWQSSNRKARSRGEGVGPESALTMQPFSLRATNLRPKFWPVFFDNSSGISVTITYRSDMFVPSTVRRFGDQIRLIAAEWVEHPRARIGSVSLNLR